VTTVPPNISMQSGVLAYLVKPFRREALLEALRQALSWHDQVVASGARPEDPSILDQWLDELNPDQF
jgi:YesN/AraC family two-component response regulator